MYKTCFECPQMKQKNRKGRPLYYCRKILKETKEYFYIDKAGTRPRRCPLLKINKKEKRSMENEENKEQVDRERMERDIMKRQGVEELDITAEIIKLYQNDPISHQVIQYLLAKYRIIPLNAVESIRQHREEILLNIVKTYKKMWDMRGKIMLKALQTSDKPVQIIVERKEKNEDNQDQGKGSRTKDNVIEGDNNGGANQGEIDKEDSQGA